MAGNDENVYVEFDYDNITLVDPNKVVSADGQVSERLVKHENLVIYANLEAELLPRTRLAVNNKGNLESEKVSVASVNFMKPGNKTFLTNEYLDVMTGQFEDDNVQGYNKYIGQTDNNYLDTEMLLITQISIENNLSSISQVTIEMEDVRGRALFEKGDQSPYAVFFNYPYPIFYLTVKGYYGKAVKHQLALLSFNARFNSQTGNFSITVKFFTYKFNVLSQLKMQYLLSLPFMYQTQYTVTDKVEQGAQSAKNTAGEGSKGTVNVIATSKGLQKLNEVYSDYKAKKLLPNDFPNLTIQDLLSRLENLETYIMNSLSQADLKPLTDATNYANLILEFEQQVFLYQSESWYAKFMDQENYFITYDKQKVYTFKKEVRESGNSDKAIKELQEGIIKKYNKSLSEVPGFGGSEPKNSELSVNVQIQYKDINIPELTPSKINWEETYKQRTGKEPFIGNAQNQTQSTDFQIFKQSGETIINNSVTEENGKPKYFWFRFEGDNSFTTKLQEARNNLNKKIDEYNKKLSEKLSSRLQAKDNPLGFKPLLYNFIAVVMASAEAFLRLLCDVHEKAWDQRNSEIRRSSIIDTNKTVTSPDAKNSVQTTGSNLIPIYPWPLYFVQGGSDSKEPFILTYPGDSSVISQTQGYRYDVWPEVEFVEEFLKGRVLNTQVSSKLGSLNNTAVNTDKVSLNALDFPTSDIIFSQKQNVKFLYEIWERIYLYSNYERFMREGTESELAPVIAESELLNIKNSVSTDSPELVRLLREISFNSRNFTDVMKNISNGGTGESWQKYIRDIFVTEYIQSNVDNSFRIFDDSIATPGFNIVTVEPKTMDKFKTYLSSTKSNTPNFTDTFPFNLNVEWFKSNISNGSATTKSDLYNTTKVLEINEDKKMIGNFQSSTTVNQKRPITSFSYLKIESDPKPEQWLLKSFYESRINNKNLQLPTEGMVYYGNNYENKLSSSQTTSFLNTPYFVNAIQKGVENFKSGNKTPYVEAAFLFLNSLPLATLREKYKNYDNQIKGVSLDNIFASFKKFGAIHKLPYAWLLKYGSIWHRYKKWINDGVDILSGVTKTFDPIYNFDPKTLNPTKKYSFVLNNQNQEVVLQDLVLSNGLENYVMNVGFYPKLINDFNVFYKGVDLFNTYSDSEIQQVLDNNTSGATAVLNSQSSFSTDKGYDPSNPNQTLDFRTWSCVIPENNKQFVVPSFGSDVNQVLDECFPNNQTDTTNLGNTKIIDNYSVFNGSVRYFWKLPHYGYFDVDKVSVPTPLEYMKEILSNTDYQDSFALSNGSYSTIEEMFSVFDYKVLDILEEEFLKFSSTYYDLKISTNNLNQITQVITLNLPSDSDGEFKNFQLFMKNMMLVNKTSTDSSVFNIEVQNSQFQNVINRIQTFLEFDVVVKHGNPSSFERKLFDSFSTIKTIEDPYTYNSYQGTNTLPYPGNNTLTLNNYVTSFPNEWKALQTYVGFSTLEGLQYTSTGSTITDFFIDMNVEFTVDNIKQFAPLIKIYATQKHKDPTYNSGKFRLDINQYLRDNENFSDLVFNSLFTNLRKELPQISEEPKRNVNTAVIGEQTKLQLWDSFKALNDTWIAGYDYKQTTFLEDVLLLDRASRNVDKDILLDPFVTRNLFPSSKGEIGINQESAVWGLLTSVIQQHNFFVNQTSSWVNFYGVQSIDQNANPKPEGTLEFGNTLFGTFLNVDTRDSSPKIVCTLNSIGSEHTDTSNNEMNKFGDDAFRLERRGNPLTESYDANTNWAKVNKVVGFNVDIGIRNQNIFYHFDVSQDIGKETIESLKYTDYIINEANGKKGASQNVSLYSFYTKRSYECQVRCMGNAMIQPMMYFNVRYVPMFYGPYMITNVKHNITPGLFETTFRGTRQSLFAFPPISESNYIQLITRQLLDTIKGKLTQPQQTTNQKDDDKKNLSTITSAKFGDIDISDNCKSRLPKKYELFTPATQLAGSSSPQEVADNLKKYVVGTQRDDIVRVLCFVTCYLATYQTNSFVYYNNNICNAMLYREKIAQGNNNSEFPSRDSYGGNLGDYFNKNYLCRKDSKDGYSKPMACFENMEKVFTFMTKLWSSNAGNAQINDSKSIFNAWYTRWNRYADQNDLNNYVNSNKEEYDNTIARIDEAIKLAKSVKLIVS